MTELTAIRRSRPVVSSPETPNAASEQDMHWDLRVRVDDSAETILPLSYAVTSHDGALEDTPLTAPVSSAGAPNTRYPKATFPFKWRPRLKPLNYRAYSEALMLAEKHWIIASILFIVTLIGSSVTIGWSLRLSTFQVAPSPLDLVSHIGPKGLVVLNTNLIAIDADEQSITLDWFVDHVCHVDDSCPDANIYFDQNLLRGNSIPTANNEKPIPIFTLDATDYLAYYYGLDYRFNSAVFRTQVAMTNFKNGGRSRQSYPFDKYTATLVFFAQTVSDNSTVPIVFDDSDGIAVGFNAKLDLQASGKFPQDVVVRELVVTRGQVIRIYALLVVIAIWLITIIFIMACIVAVFLGKGARSDFLVLPLATLFAFTQLRGTMPGAPSGFGANIDFIGVLPCLVLLTFSSVFMSAVFLFRNPEVDAPRWTNRHIVWASRPTHARNQNVTV
ncbi:hypothetical protein DAEQUDRAFT_760290 [Daedalea quercina L-15889]|uniref:DUF4436 domain-containing protein n=1 Tax=Daedalea quercina L-15889 TaxID=1314783 RepID=A0A165KZX0_9APHY|nr:hypothetical protein DAEQUDRAFT_760290 [Daedalea quercina L-15889]